MTEKNISYGLLFECRMPDASPNNENVEWFTLPMTFGGSLAATHQLIADICIGDAGVSLETATCAVVIQASMFDGNETSVLERRGLSPQRLAELIGFQPTSRHLHNTLAASEAVHTQTRLHPLLLRGRQVPAEAQQQAA